MQIKRLPKSFRPRERLMVHDGEILSDTELLSIILISGNASQNENAINLANIILEKYGGLSNLSNTSIEELKQISGIGVAKACQIKAALILGKRSLDKELTGKVINNSRDAYNCIYPVISGEEQECFVVLLLNVKNRITGRHIISKGTTNFCPCSPSDVLSIALKRRAASIILAHNHPSGIVKPSQEDINITKRYDDATKLLGMKLLDHLIITTNNQYYSFADNHQIKSRKCA